MAVILTSEQETGFEAAMDFVETFNWNRKPYFTIGGLAGTGKTTLLAELREEIPPGFKVCSLTGKAVQVLRSKGISEAATIHATIYKLTKAEGKSLHFRLKQPFEIDFEGLFIDEASMVSREIFEDLLKLKVPIIFIGDHGQLEPVGNDPKLMEILDVRLETVHRQALDSEIIRFAHYIREGGMPHRYTPETSDVTIIKQSNLDFDPEQQQLLCGYNQTRNTINGLCREHLGYTGIVAEGEKVICLRNSKDFNVFNGLMGHVEKIHDVTPYEVRADVRCEDGTLLSQLPMFPAQFGVPKTLQMRHRDLKDTTLWDQAHAITCHKSQGSEWDHVFVYYEPSSLWDTSRWLYTASARAIKTLTVAIP